MTHDQTTPAPVEVTADPDDIVTMAKELAADPSNTLYGNMVLGIMCATIIDLRADLAKARIAHSAPADVGGLVEALRSLLNALDSCVDLTPSVIARARQALAKHTRAQGEG